MDFINTILDYAELGFQAIKNLVLGLFQLLTMLPDMLTFGQSLTAFLPVFLVGFFVLGLTIKILLVTIGRNHG